jgi:hypothetical protein
MQARGAAQQVRLAALATLSRSDAGGTEFVEVFVPGALGVLENRCS